MVFMGTPHRGTGTSLHSQGQIYQAVLAGGFHVEDQILKTLEEGNETLVDVVREFTRLINIPPLKMNVFCFFEKKPTAVGEIIKDDKIKVSGPSPALLHVCITPQVLTDSGICCR
jgi:hypothetical protein